VVLRPQHLSEVGSTGCTMTLLERKTLTLNDAFELATLDKKVVYSNID